VTDDVLEAAHSVEYTYTRSTGPIIGAFLTGLRDRRFVGVRTRDGRVLVPPAEYDPVTSEDLDELVDVGDTGVVTTWSWNDAPLAGQPLSHPFAWALVQLDGADTSMLTAVDAGDRSVMRTGLRVRARWADERVGSVRDIECFEPQPVQADTAQADTVQADTGQADTGQAES
jgi:uncharacterized OB-fold protein